MEKKSGFGQIFAVSAVTFMLVAVFMGGADIAYSADAQKEKPADVKATLADKKAKAPETDSAKPGEKALTEVNPTELLIKGSKTFMEGAEMVKNPKEKATGEKMMLEGHKMMAETETLWSKSGKELSSAQKSASEAHSMLMKGYTLLKGDKDAEQGNKMVQDGLRKLGDAIKNIQVPTNGKDKK